MDPRPANDPANEQHDQTGADEHRTGADEQPVADDGSVPAKQIHRWKDEGGSLHPAE